ncbi:MAG TPA: [protein-PII] uridylyltransferase [Bacteroidota bacterium]|nr:[protein-PII] uridylyltransferase [Bacteroidota bacterium]
MTIKERFTSGSAEIFQLHRNGADGFTVASRLTSLVDTTLADLWNVNPMHDNFAVVALGGYGRCELCPHSDFDLMVLAENEKAKNAGSATIQEFLRSLWDAGFNVGHSVRTIQDCVNLYETDVDSWASILESRFVSGSRQVLRVYADAVFKQIQKKFDLVFVKAIMVGMDERHEKYGNSVKLLEPNVKNSAGGLRDLHNLLWVYRSTDTDYFSDSPFLSGESSCKLMLDTFYRKNVISKEERDAVTSALNFLLRTRHETHYLAKTIHDSLDFSIQREIATGLGYGEDKELQYVEKFMREYFLHARSIFRLNQRLINHFRKSVEPSSWRKPKEQILDTHFIARGDELLQRNTAVEISTPAEILKAFYWCGKLSFNLGHSLQGKLASLGSSPHIFNEQTITSEEAANVFLDILRLPSNVASTLTMMNDFDVLGKYIPEWGELVAFVQHSIYHYYTADAHTLIALEHAERLSEGKGILSRVYRGLEKKEILYLALLLHDIEKPNGIQEHEIRGVDTARRVLERIHYRDEFGDVAFLIRNHLMMEQIAFRRNISDPKTIAEFAEMFQRPEQLDLLFLVTYCDLSAVNKNVWTSWKEMLLQELYVRTRRILERKLPFKEAVSFQREQYQEAARALVQSMSEHIPREEVEHHISSIHNEAYIQIFTENEIAEHLAHIRKLDTLSSIVSHEDSHSAVTVITQDAPFLLSNLCGVLSANDANIFDAQIFTRDDGIVIDRFRVVNVSTKAGLQDEQVEKIKQDFDDVMRGNVTLEHLFEKHHRRWKRRVQPLFHPNIRIDVVFEDAQDFTIADVYAPDAVGFLYKVTRTFSQLGLNIHFAKIATRVDGIVDSFYILDADGKPIRSKERKEQIKERVLHRVYQLINIQLSTQ